MDAVKAALPEQLELFDRPSRQRLSAAVRRYPLYMRKFFSQIEQYVSQFFRLERYRVAVLQEYRLAAV